MNNWFDREAEALEQQLANGEISSKEFHREMAELRRALRDAASEHAREAYDDYMGGW